MELNGSEVLHARPNQLAATLIQRVGDQAQSLAKEQAAKSRGDEAIASLWREVAAVMTPLIQANLHLELALDLLDSIGETSVPPLLDSAIVRLGVRSAGADRSSPTGVDDPHADLGSLRERAQRHLDVAATRNDPDLRVLHLDMASRFATMRENGRSLVAAG